MGHHLFFIHNYLFLKFYQWLTISTNFFFIYSIFFLSTVTNTYTMVPWNVISIMKMKLMRYTIPISWTNYWIFFCDNAFWKKILWEKDEFGKVWKITLWQNHKVFSCNNRKIMLYKQKTDVQYLYTWIMWHLLHIICNLI